VDGRVGDWSLEVEATNDCRGGERVSARAELMKPGDLVPGGRVDRPLGPVGLTELPIYCRRDDYAFLPPNALGGLPCVGVPRHDEIGPQALALALEAAVPPPALRIGMNPKMGLVAVPTWFWVEGYDGGDIGAAQTVLKQWVEE